MLNSAVLMFAFACQSQNEGLVYGDIESLRVEPTEITLVTSPEQPATADFTAFATMKDGEEIEMDLLSWKISNLSSGHVDEDGHFESVDTNGGVTDVIAQSFGVEASGPDDHRCASAATEFEMLEGSLRTGEIDQTMGMAQAVRNI